MADLILHNAVVELDNDSNVLQTITTQANRVEITVEKNVGEYFTFGSAWAKNGEGGKRFKVTLKCIATTTTSEAYELLRSWMLSGSGARTIRLSVPDGSAGSGRYSGEVILQDMSPMHIQEAGKGEPVEIVANMVGTGALSYATI